MIFEAIQHFLTPASPEVKALGYVREAIAIEARYKRCRTAWADHLEKCQQKILAVANTLDSGATIMVIGSGALHDVPLTALLGLGHRPILVDIIHLPKIRKLPNIQLIEQDVTGWVGPLFHKKSTPESPAVLPRADLVISLNILSQLPLNLIAYAGKYDIPLPDNFAQTIMAAHLKLLASVAPQKLIISDLERLYYKGDELVEKESALPDGLMTSPSDTWDWHIAPKGELDRDISLIHHVGCWQM